MTIRLDTGAPDLLARLSATRDSRAPALANTGSAGMLIAATALKNAVVKAKNGATIFLVI